jgi:hypothetical protein
MSTIKRGVYHSFTTPPERNPAHRTLPTVLANPPVRGHYPGCSQGFGSNLFTGCEHQDRNRPLCQHRGTSSLSGSSIRVRCAHRNLSGKAENIRRGERRLPLGVSARNAFHFDTPATTPGQCGTTFV